jgi:hypothetical protein
MMDYTDGRAHGFEEIRQQLLFESRYPQINKNCHIQKSAS